MGVATGIAISVTDGVIDVLGYATCVALGGAFYMAWRARQFAFYIDWRTRQFVSAVSHVAERVAAHWHLNGIVRVRRPRSVRGSS
jgi:hypothetical protein